MSVRREAIRAGVSSISQITAKPTISGGGAHAASEKEDHVKELVTGEPKNGATLRGTEGISTHV